MLRPFASYVEQGRAKRVAPDLAEAKGLLRTGVEDLEATVRMVPLSEETASYFFKNVYESVRSALQASLAKAGYKPYSHEAVIAFNLELGVISEGEAAKLDKFRELRHDIVYRAERATVAEARELLELARVLVARVEGRIQARSQRAGDALGRPAAVAPPTSTSAASTSSCAARSSS